MTRVSRRVALAALSRITPAVLPAHRADLDLLAAFFGTSVPELLRMGAGYTPVEVRSRLQVSLPTVHVWIADGLLPQLPGPKGALLLLDRAFVDRFADALDAVRAAGTPKHLLRDVAAMLETKEFAQQNPDIARRIQSGKRGQRAPWREVLAEAWRAPPPTGSKSAPAGGRAVRGDAKRRARDAS